MKKIALIPLALCLALNICQAGTPARSDTLHVTAGRNPGEPGPEQSVRPSFDGGNADRFSSWVVRELTYPQEAKKNNIEGRVLMRFTIDEAGRVTDVSVIRGVEPSLDREAFRVVSSSPRWTPARNADGKPIACTYTFPVVFQLR